VHQILGLEALDVGQFKPIVSGIEQTTERDVEDVGRLKMGSVAETLSHLVN